MTLSEHPLRDLVRALTEESLAPLPAGALATAVPGGIAALADPYPAMQALARAADDPHTVLFSNAAGASLMAIIGGGPSTDPGLAFARLDDGRLVVTEVVAGGAGAATGVRPGDILTAIAGQRVTHGMQVHVAILGAPEGTRVSIDVERGGEPRTLALEVTKALLPVLSSRIAPPGVGLVRLRWITASPDPERDASALLRRALDELARSGARAIVLDLRGNQGGYGVTRVASVLTDGDPIAVYRHPSGEEERAGRAGERSPVRLPLAVLVDEETTSAAELVALALQEHGNARVVGRPTAGALNIPRQMPVGPDHTLMFPSSLALGPRTRTAPAGMRVMPDVSTPGRTPEDLATGRDVQLDVALAITAG